LRRSPNRPSAGGNPWSTRRGLCTRRILITSLRRQRTRRHEGGCCAPRALGSLSSGSQGRRLKKRRPPAPPGSRLPRQGWKVLNTMSVTPNRRRRVRQEGLRDKPRAKNRRRSSRTPGDLPRAGGLELRTQPVDPAGGDPSCEGHHTGRGWWDVVPAALRGNGPTTRLCAILIVRRVALVIPFLLIMLAHVYLAGGPAGQARPGHPPPPAHVQVISSKSQPVPPGARG
jgi:hypothetical protein